MPATHSSRIVLPVFLLIVFLGAMVLGPLLDLALAPFGVAFHRVMSRALLMCALAALFLFRQRLRLREWWQPGKTAARQVAFGYACAFVSGAAMIGLYFFCCGFQSAHLSSLLLVRSLLTALLAAAIVPVLEETIFRGFLLTNLVEVMGRPFGWLLAALIYTVAHFLRVPASLSPHPIHLGSGAAAVAAIFTHLGDGLFADWRAASLVVVGLILGDLFLRAKTLWPGAALHSGWIFILMSFSALTRPLPSPHLAWLGGNLLSTPLPFLVLVVLEIGLKIYGRPRNEVVSKSLLTPEN